MRILFIIPSYKPAYIYGGTTVVVSELAEELVKAGNDVTVYATTANGASELDVDPDKETLVNGVKVYYFTRITKDHTHLSISLLKDLWRDSRNFDIVHIHSWWSALVLSAAAVCRLKGIKPLISPHGMLSNYSFTRQKSILKKGLHHLFGKSLLKHSYLHVSTEQEWKESLLINPEWQGFIASNLISLPENVPPRQKNEVFTLSFLSRIDPKKGLDLVFKALAKVSFPFKLLIGGVGDSEYIEQLKQMATELGVSSQVEWTGWKGGKDKFEFLAGSDLFLLTSYNENFAIVVIEALACGTPVVLSNMVGISSYVIKKQLGWVSDLDENNLADSLSLAYNAVENRKRIEANASSIIYEDFNNAKLTREYLNFYTKILSLSNKFKNRKIHTIG